MFLLLLLCTIVKIVVCVPEEAHLTVPQIIRKHGYPFEQHTVTTADGYILGIFRIPHGRNEIPDGTQRIPVLLMPAMTNTAEHWVITGPKAGIAYNLADEGYDIWMVNRRGSTYSLNHTHFDPTPIVGKFWDFSFYETGVGDLPASIDYILDHTQQKKLFYVGFSQGGTEFYVLCSELPAYNDKIIAFAGFAAPAFLKHAKLPNNYGIFDVGARFIENFAIHLTPLVKAMIPHPEIFEKIPLLQVLWATLVAKAVGYNAKEENMTLLITVIPHVIVGTNGKTFAHYYQFKRFGRFAQYDYGEAQNLRKYNATRPPLMNLKNIKTPIHLFHSDNDMFMQPEDLKTFRKTMPGYVEMIHMEDKEWTHANFVYAKSVPEVVNKRVIKIFNQYRMKMN